MNPSIPAYESNTVIVTEPLNQMVTHCNTQIKNDPCHSLIKNFIYAFFKGSLITPFSILIFYMTLNKNLQSKVTAAEACDRQKVQPPGSQQ